MESDLLVRDFAVLAAGPDPTELMVSECWQSVEELLFTGKGTTFNNLTWIPHPVYC